MVNYDFLNFLIAVLALLVAVYSIHYTRKSNRRKLFIGNGIFISESENTFIARFEIHNISPVPVTLSSFDFFTLSGDSIHPLLNYEPEKSYTTISGFGSGFIETSIPNIIPEYMYADMLDAPYILQPYSSIEFGYYFDTPYESMEIKVTCEERIYHFKKHRSFLIHFSYVEE